MRHATAFPIIAPLKKLLGAGLILLLPWLHVPPLFGALLLLGSFAAAFLLLGKRIDLRAMEGLRPRPFSPSRADLLNPWFFGGLALAAGMLAYLEWMQPYYFSVDDNHAQFIPVVLASMRGFFAEWTLPTWNAYQMLGQPTMSLGNYALTYPVTYLSYLAAAYLFGDELKIMEAYAWFHLLAGYAATHFMLRAAGARPAVAATGAVCFALSGALLVAGRSWFIYIALAVYLPLAAWSLVTFAAAPRVTARWVILSGLALGIGFHTGHAQMWIYTFIFWGMGLGWIALFKEGGPLRNLAAAAAAVLFCLAVAAPLFLIQYLEVKDLQGPTFNFGIQPLLDKLLWPSGGPAWNVFFNDVNLFFGPLFYLLFVLMAAASLAYGCRGKPARPFLQMMAFPLLTIFFLIWSLGEEGRLWMWMMHIPPFSQFNSPVKLLPIVHLGAMVSGVLLLENVLAARMRIPSAALYGLLATSLVLTVYNASQCKQGFYMYGEYPYPPLPAEYTSLPFPKGFTAGGERIFSFTPLRWRKPPEDNVLTLGHDYASYYEVLSAIGYDRGTSNSRPNARAGRMREKNFVRYLNHHGITKVLVPRHRPRRSEYNYYPKRMELEALATNVTDAGKVKIYDVKTEATAPLAYYSGQYAPPLPLRIAPNGVEIKHEETAPSFTADTVTANFLYRPWFRAFSGEGRELSARPDAPGRIQITGATGSALIRVTYSPPWRYGMAAAAIALLLAILLFFLHQRLMAR